MGCGCGKKANIVASKAAMDKKTCIEGVVNLLRESPQSLPDGWWHWENVQEAFKVIAADYIKSISVYPGTFSGRGIVICAGGKRLFTCGWVCAKMLRHFGCQLPIQFWHFDHEVDDYMAELVAPLGVSCINVANFPKPRILNGWELKPFAILNSCYKEILLLDADNVPVKDPTFLFDSEAYKTKHAVFWPDYGSLANDRPIWKLFETEYVAMKEFESGQILVDKEKCWKELNLSMFMNAYSDYYYKWIHGDKCTFQMAWLRLKTPFHIMKKEIHSLDSTMCQHDENGKRLFQHRNMDKWSFDGNKKINDFWFEDICRKFVVELNEKWPGTPFHTSNTSLVEYKEIAGKKLVYNRVGYDKRILQFKEDGSIGEGAARMESRWVLNKKNSRVILTIFSDTNSPTCYLAKEGELWQGNWLNYEKMPIQLTIAQQ